MKKPVSTVLLPLLLGLHPGLALEAQESDSVAAPSPPSEIFFEALEVNLVNVDVWVTDKKGEPITGLKADDFEIFEDSRPIEVTNFYAVEEGRRQADPAPAPGAEDAAPAEPPPLPIAPKIEEPPIPENQRLHLVIYFDNLHLRPFNRNRVARQVRDFLYEYVTPEDRTMLVTFERGLHIREHFTTDSRKIARALQGIEKLTGFAVQSQSERRLVIRRIEDSETFGEAESHVDFYAKSVFDDTLNSIKTLKELVASLAGLPGRKALLHVSDGMPMTAGEDLFYMIDQRFGDRSTGQMRSLQYRARRQYQELVNHANANRVTFYTLEAAGARGASSISAEHTGAQSGGSFLEIDFVRDANYQAPLQFMAYETGGQASFNTNNVRGALQKIGRDFKTYYSLGYLPAHSGDGRYHDIRVKVNRPGAKVRYRRGYRDKTINTRLDEGTLASLLYGADTNPLGVKIEFEGSRSRDDGHFLVPVLVRIPLAKVTVIPQENFHHGRLRVAVAVIDDRGNRSIPDQSPVPIHIPEGDLAMAREKFFVYSVELLMRRGDQKVAVGVRDEFAGQTSFISTPVTIPVRMGG